MKRFISCLLVLVVVLSLVVQTFGISVVKVTGIKVDMASTSLKVGDTGRVTITFTPANTTQRLLTYSTSNKNVVSVTADGIVKAEGVGKADITVTSQSNTAVSAKVTVTVKAKPETTLTVMLYDRGNVGGTPPDNNFYSKWIQDTFHKANPDINIKFVTAPRWTGDDKLNIWMASNQAPDISITYAGGLVDNYYNQKGLTPLDDALKIYGQDLIKWYGDPRTCLNFGKKYGKQMALPARRIIAASTNTWIRKDWLDALNLPIPTTRDEWYNAMKAFKEKNPAKVGKVIPFGMSYDPLWNAGNLLESFCTDKSDLSRYLASDTMKMIAPGYKEGVRFLNKMYNEGLISKEFPLDTENKILASDFANNYVGCYIQNFDIPFISSGTGYIPTMKKKYPGFDLQPIDPFKDKDGVTTKKGYAGFGIFIMVPKTSEKKVNEAVRYLNWMCDPKVLDFLQFGEEGVTHTVNSEGLKVLNPPKTGDKQFNSTQNLDYTLIVNGIDTGDQTKNVKIASLSYGSEPGLAELFIKSVTTATTNAYAEPSVTIPSVQGAKYAISIRDKEREMYAKTITCKPEDFDAVWQKMFNEFLSSGASAVLEERRALWKQEKALNN